MNRPETPAASFMQTTDPDALVEAAPRLPAGTLLGAWKLDALIGSGGMGEVYQAHRADGRYEQTVAIKVLRPGNHDWRQRFELERRRLAALTHPAVSRLIDGGECDDGRPFMAMELVEGSPIREFARAQRLPQQAVIELMIAVCEVVSLTASSFCTAT
jgi:serine/threonine protein kinase